MQSRGGDDGSGAIEFCLAGKDKVWRVSDLFYGCVVLGSSLEEVVVKRAEQEVQFETVFPKEYVNGSNPLVPALQCCLLQSPLPD